MSSTASSSAVADIKERLDIVEYVSRFVPDLKKQGSLYKACCPFHSEKTPSFVVNPANQSWRCFGQCAVGGDVFSFAMKKHGWSFTEALTELGSLTGVETRRERSPQQREQDARRERLRGLLKVAAEYYHEHLMSDDPAADRVREYVLLKRGLTLETVRRFQIGFAPEGWSHMLDALTALGYSPTEIGDAGLTSTNDKGRTYDRFRNRLMIPICDERGRVTGFGARALNPDDNPKYLNSPQSLMFDKSRTLFGLHLAKTAIRETGCAVIVEGYMDAIQAHQAGFANVVAQMGTALTETQLALVAPRYATRLVLALDADAAGQNAMRRSLEVARQTLVTRSGTLSADIRIMQIADAKDPDDVLRETPGLWQRYVDEAVPVADFVIALETQKLPLNATLQERQAVAQSLLPILAVSENNALNRENMQKLALALRLDVRDVFDWADRMKPHKPATRSSEPRRAAPAAPPPAPVPDAPPPLLDEMPTSEEPPPFFGDEAGTAPPEAELRLPNPPQPRLVSRTSSRAAEFACLREMIRDFNLYYTVNFTFREICALLPAESAASWDELTPVDFLETDLRMILQLWVDAHRQDDHTPQQYVESSLDDTLRPLWIALLEDDVQHIHTTIAGRMRPELEDIIRQQQRVLTENELRRLRLRRILEVRDKRLRRELTELNFLLRETPPHDDAARELLHRVQQTLRIQAAFQRGLSEFV